jgi:hypothetical protein
VPVLRAGLRESFVTGIPAILISATARPIARGAKPYGARLSVAPRMIKRNMNAKTVSA